MSPGLFKFLHDLLELLLQNATDMNVTKNNCNLVREFLQSHSFLNSPTTKLSLPQISEDVSA